MSTSCPQEISQALENLLAVGDVPPNTSISLYLQCTYSIFLKLDWNCLDLKTCTGKYFWKFCKVVAQVVWQQSRSSLVQWWHCALLIREMTNRQRVRAAAYLPQITQFSPLVVPVLETWSTSTQKIGTSLGLFECCNSNLWPWKENVKTLWKDLILSIPCQKWSLKTNTNALLVIWKQAPLCTSDLECNLAPLNFSLDSYRRRCASPRDSIPSQSINLYR